MAPEGLKAGMTVHSGLGAEAKKLGNCLPLTDDPDGSCRSTTSKWCRAAVRSSAALPVSSTTLTAREGSWAQITLPSGEVRRIPGRCRATIGAVGNAEHMKIRLGKARPQSGGSVAGRTSAARP